MSLEAIDTDSESVAQVSMTDESLNVRNVHEYASATVTTYTLNSSTAVTIAVANADRVFLNVSLDSGALDRDVFVRLYPAATDNNQAGMLLARRTSSNDALFWPMWQMPTDSIYTGEISAITSSDTIDVHVTEYSRP